MFTINSKLEIDHLVVLERDRKIFAAARSSGHLYLFLVNEDSGSVYSRNSSTDSWERVMETDRRLILARITAARNRQIPIYRIRSSL
ncbi:MAG: hypothetical protein V2A64_02020 [Candidatus Omnitrophota bacterium]